MIFKEVISVSASSAAATTYLTQHIVGELRKIRMVKGTLSTSKTHTFRVDGDSTTIAFAKYKFGTTGQSYYPTITSQGATGAGSSEAMPLVLANERIRMRIVATTSSAKRTATVSLYFDGIPGLGGTTTT